MPALLPVEDYDHILPIQKDEAVKAVGSEAALASHLQSSFGSGCVPLIEEVVLREIKDELVLCAVGDDAEDRTQKVRNLIPLGSRQVRHYRRILISA